MNENKVVAIVNGKEITQDNVMRFLNDLGPQVAMQFQSPEGMKKVIEELVNQELLFLEAKENKLDEQDEFTKLLDETKATLLKSYALGKLIENEVASNEDIKAYYEENKEKFTKDATVEAKHILVEEEEMASKIADEINEGLSFEDAARKYSTCPSKEQGGNLGEFGRGQMVPEFEDAAFEMEVNSISGPVKTQFGFHLIKLLGKNESSIKSFEEVETEIAQQLTRMKQQDIYLGKINELKGKYTVEVK